MAANTEEVTNNEASNRVENKSAGEVAEIVRTPDGDAHGVAIFLTTEELLALGIEPESAEAVVPVVTGDRLALNPLSQE